MTLAQGYVLEGKYVVTRQIAEGGMSTVYLGENRRIGKAVAVKVLHRAMTALPDVVERFEREARILSRIRSTHVADVYDFGELPTGEHFMVMEYLEGESLATMLEREHTLPARALSSIAVQILSALSAAHLVGVVHRDLKPENIIVTTRGAETIVKVVDFGISKCAGIGRDELRKTAADALMGTPLYMSPEQARGNTAAVDERTDLYALGVILYEATAGELPLNGDNVQDVLYRIAVEDPAPLESRIPTVEPALAAIVRKAMAKATEDRFASAAEMLQAVEDWRALHVSASLVPADPAASGAHSTAPVVLSAASSSAARTVASPLTAQADAAAAPDDLAAAPASERRPRLGRGTKALALAAVAAAMVASVYATQKAGTASHTHDVASASAAMVASPALQSATVVAPVAGNTEELPAAAPDPSPVAAGAASARPALPRPASTLAGGTATAARTHRPAGVLDAGKTTAALPVAVGAPEPTVGVSEARPAARPSTPAPSPVRRAYRASFE